ncbi:MAG: twin-arginine translocase subunit TatC [candidate division Zixibacteria bacterium]|nr:twin-arginine translocase subunit TatC [candidate division Zixibacteria bacterium]
MNPQRFEANDHDTDDLPLLEHLEELRQRLIRILASLLIFSIISYLFSDYLLDQVVKPVGVVYFREPTGAFMVRIKISLFCGIMISVPVILYHFWKFVVPGLYAREIKHLLPVVMFGTLFFFGGAAFCYLVVVPIAMDFLKSFATENVKAWIDIKEYFSFVIYMCLAFGVVFELPIISYFFGKIGIVTSKMLSRWRRYALVIILVLAMVLTPPDVFSQMLLALPLYLLYEVSIIVVRLTGRREEKPDTD